MGGAGAAAVEAPAPGAPAADRLESLADPGGICISRTVHENIRNKLPLNYEDLGEQAVKNIAEPVRVFRVMLDGGAATPTRHRQCGAQRYVTPPISSISGLAIIAATNIFT